MTAIQHLRGATTEWAAAQTTLGTTPVVAAGEIAFDTTTGTLKIGDGATLWGSLPYISVPPGGTDGQILARSGTLSSAWIDNYSTSTKHQVKLAEPVNKGQAVYVSSATGNNMLVSKASNSTETTSSKTMGLIESSGTTNDFVNVITEGLLTGTGSSPLDTSSAGSEGDPVWLGTSGNLIYGLANKPVAPSHLVFIGIVTRKHAVQGEIFVRIQNGFEIDELHDVKITSATLGDVITRTSNNIWENSTPNNAGLVATTGNQTIAGTKTFSSTISGSIDGNANTVTNGVYTTGNQTIGGTKTFSSRVLSSANQGIPYAMSSGYVNVSGTAARGIAAAVTFPNGRFTQAPMVTATVGSASAVSLNASAYSITTSGMTVQLYHVNDTSTWSGPYSCMWIAVQMTDAAYSAGVAL